MKPIYQTIEVVSNYLREILPQFSQVEFHFDDKVEYIEESGTFWGKVSSSKYIISLSLSQIDSIVKYDCRIESETDKHNVCEHEFNHETMTLKETLDYAYSWIKENGVKK